MADYSLLNDPEMSEIFESFVVETKETLEKLTELNSIVHLAFGVRDFPIHTDLPVADFPFEHQAYEFANALSQITTGSGVLHFGLPVDVNFS